MPTYMAPDIYIEEVAGGTRPIEAVGTSTAGFVGLAPDAAAHLNEAVSIINWSQFLREFVPAGTASTPPHSSSSRIASEPSGTPASASIVTRPRTRWR